jgi:hypothetical protein
MPSQSILSAIRASADAHAALVQGINDLEYAQSARDVCAEHLEDLRKQERRSTTALMAAVRNTAQTRTDYLERKSKWRRRISSKAKAREEEA